MCTAMFILLWKSQVADTMQVCSLCQTRVSKRWITMPRISDITQTGSRAKEKEDHLSLTVFQLQDETSVSGVRQKTPFSPNCLVNPEVVRAGAELCKRRRDEANCTTSLWWGQSGFTDVSERSGYPDGMEWRGFIEAEQEMIRNILGGANHLRCWDEAKFLKTVLPNNFHKAVWALPALWSGWSNEPCPASLATPGACNYVNRCLSSTRWSNRCS